MATDLDPGVIRPAVVGVVDHGRRQPQDAVLDGGQSGLAPIVGISAGRRGRGNSSHGYKYRADGDGRQLIAFDLDATDGQNLDLLTADARRSDVAAGAELSNDQINGVIWSSRPRRALPYTS